MKTKRLIATKDKNVFLWILDFIKNASSTKIWILALLFSGLSLVLSFYTSESNFFSASGGVITILGLIIFVGISTPVSLQEIDKVVQSQVTGTPKIREDNGAQLIRYIANVVDETIHSRTRQILGLSITTFGTLIWAYGWGIESIPCFSTP